MLTKNTNTPNRVLEELSNPSSTTRTAGRQTSAPKTKAAGKNLSKKYKDLFHKTREDFKKNVYDIPLANKAYRLKELQKIYEDWKNNRLMKQGVIKQVREEMQGYDLMLLNLELKQLEIEKLREGEGDEDPTPVKVTIQVVDASKKDAEHQSDAECTSG